ncbi:tubulin binding cofactor A [Gigaspora margarita]|uniref:Tubulin-specific chaperone A n=1 Tax=Gigaspora margarita TaxID=4874 RepID=A0A8H4AH90_GIGMA|nr:tubulin binding cofactor A [Gigaspora margarita]
MSNPLKIKTGVVKRYFKEEKSYHKEVEDQEKRIERLTAEGADPSVLNKEREVLEESLRIIPDVQSRLKAAYEELRNLVDQKDPRYVGTSELEEAESVLEEVGPKIGIQDK